MLYLKYIFVYIYSLLVYKKSNNQKQARSENHTRTHYQDYFDWLSQTVPGSGLVADAVWHDLGAQSLFLKINTTRSLCGEQVLYARMRTYVASIGEVCKLQGALGRQAAFENQSVLNAAKACFTPLRDQQVSLIPLMDGSARVIPGKLWAFVGMALFPWLALLSAFLFPPCSHFMFPLACVGMCANVVVRAVLWDGLEAWNTYFEGVFKLLAVASRLCQSVERLHVAQQAALREQIDLCYPLRRSTRFFAHSAIFQNDLMQGVLGFLNWFALADLILSLRAYSCLAPSNEALKQVFQIVGQVDADLAIHEYLAEASWSCLPAFHQENKFELHALFHPLLTSDTATDFVMKKSGMVLMGENGAGKTTLMRAIGLNVLLARTLGFCHAKSAHLPFVKIGSSVDIADDLGQGMSYFFAELQRAKALDGLIRDSEMSLILMDEPLRGTNAMESLAISSALLRDWAKRAFVVVSTHDLMLARALSEHYEHWHIARRESDGGASFVLSEGVGNKTNALDCFTRMGFSVAVCDEAKRLMTLLGEMGEVYAKELVV